MFLTRNNNFALLGEQKLLFRKYYYSYHTIYFCYMVKYMNEEKCKEINFIL